MISYLVTAMAVFSVVASVSLVLGMVYMVRGLKKFSHDNFNIATTRFKRCCVLFAASLFAISLVFMIDISLGCKSEWDIFTVIFTWVFAGLFVYLSRTKFKSTGALTRNSQ